MSLTRAAGIRCVTFNVLSHENPDWPRRRPVIADALAEVDADVIALQEVRLEDAVDLVGDGYHLTPFSNTEENGIGGVLATRMPHRVLEEIDLRSPIGAQHLAWCATVIVEADTAVGRLVIAHHKPTWPFPHENERERQALRAAFAIERYAGDGAAVVLGDFDATPDSASMRFWRGRRSIDGVSVCFQDAWETLHPAEAGVTFDGGNPLVRAGDMPTGISRRIDYVLVRSVLHGPLLRVDRCERLLDRPVDTVWASDHFGVLADLSLPEHPVGTWGAYPPIG